MLNVKEVCELSGVEPQTLRNWIAAGLIEPAGIGEVGKGKGHTFSVTQAVGLIVAERIRRSEQGCVQSYVGKVIEAFGSVTEKWLLERFKKDGFHFVMPHYKKPVFGGELQFGHPDARDALKRVKEYIEKKHRTAKAKV